MSETGLVCRQPSADERAYTTADDLLSSLSTDNEARIAQALYDERPFALDVSLLDPTVKEGACTEAFVGGLDPKTRQGIEELKEDIARANTDGDSFLTKNEIVDYVRANSERYPHPVLFLSAADHFLNILPFYAAQPDLNPNEEARLEETRQYYASVWQEADLNPAENPIEIYGVPLGSPTPPEERTPEWYAGAFILLNTARDEEGVPVGSGYAPFSPDGNGLTRRLMGLDMSELDLLASFLDGKRGEEIGGMTVLDEEADRTRTAERHQIRNECSARMEAAASDDEATRIYRECLAQVGPGDGRSLSADALVSAALFGSMTPGETRFLRKTIDEEVGPATAALQGGKMILDGITRHWWEFLIRNGAFVATSFADRRFLARQIFEVVLTRACGGPVGGAREAWTAYQGFAQAARRSAPFLVRAARGVTQNTVTELAIFNIIASYKDTDNLAVDIATDVPTVVLLERLRRLGDPSVRRFVDQNPQICQGPRQGPPTGDGYGWEPVRVRAPRGIRLPDFSRTRLPEPFIDWTGVGAALAGAAAATGKFISDNAVPIGATILAGATVVAVVVSAPVWVPAAAVAGGALLVVGGKGGFDSGTPSDGDSI